VVAHDAFKPGTSGRGGIVSGSFARGSGSDQQPSWDEIESGRCESFMVGGASAFIDSDDVLPCWQS